LTRAQSARSRHPETAEKCSRIGRGECEKLGLQPEYGTGGGDGEGDGNGDGDGAS